MYIVLRLYLDLYSNTMFLVNIHNGYHTLALRMICNIRWLGDGLFTSKSRIFSKNVHCKLAHTYIHVLAAVSLYSNVYRGRIITTKAQKNTVYNTAPAL